MPDFLDGYPFWFVFVFLYLVATLRGQGTYWLGRLVTDQTLKRIRPKPGWQTAAHAALSGEGSRRGVQAIHRWGLPVIPLCYLTIGFQTMVLAGAGLLRMRWVVFTLVQIPGALAWATIYSTVGFAMWNAALAAAAGSPWGIAGILAVTALVAWTIWHRRSRQPSECRAGVPEETSASRAHERA